MGDKWWKDSVVYQIYPQSFNDSNDDGIGDLKGIIDKLPYLVNLGIDVIWLNPIFDSPLVDNGYDISDYEKILPQYGTMEDFQELLKIAHDYKIKVILDLVVNHTSDLHQWFIESKKSNDNKYSDFYIWKDPKEDGSAPNNWGSTFGGSAWEYVPERNQYYLHCFAKEQPDLNWENPEVRNAIYKMMRKWFEIGIDGFRMDVISLISKNQLFPDATDKFVYTKSYYAGSSNGPRVHEFLQEMNREVLSHYDVITVGETPNTDSDQALLYTHPDRKELDMVFHFDHMHLDYGKYGKFSDIRYKMSDLRNVLSEWQTKLNESWNSLYWSNHDQPRAVTRFGNDGKFRIESSKMLGTLLHMMKGTPYIYQGEEIGMKNVPFENISDYKDIETKYFYSEMQNANESEEYIKKAIYLKSRDNARTPMPWDSSRKGGFTNGIPWIKESPDNISINISENLQNSESVFYHYQKLIKLRKNYPIIIHGNYRLVDENNSEVYSYLREYHNEVLLVICSFSENYINYVVPKEINDYKEKGKLLLSNYETSLGELERSNELRPYESLVYHIVK